MIMKTKTIFAATLATVFVFAMMTNPVFAVSPSLTITSVGSFTMTTGGKPGTAMDGHKVIVYAFFTSTAGGAANSFVAYVAAVHPSFNDDPTEQTPGNKRIHAHYLELDNTSLCVVGITPAPTLTISGNSISISGATGTITHWVIAGYDVTGGGLCPTQVYAFI